MAGPWDVVATGPAAQGGQWQVASQEQAPAPSWSEVPGQALSNLGSSAGMLAGDMAHMIMHPLDTAGTILDAGAGGVRKLAPKALADFLDKMDKPEDTARIEAGANTFGAGLDDRFGSSENLRRTLATDPVGAAADLSGVLTLGGGAAARIPGLARAGAVAQQAGRMIDPIAQTANVAGRVIEPIVSNTLGLTTGAGVQSVREAARTGYQGGAEGAAFRDSMRGDIPASHVVDTARTAVAEIRQQRGAAYRADMAAVNQDPTVLNFAPINRAIRDVADVGVFQGRVINRSAAPVWTAIENVVDEWRMSDPAIVHTDEGMDALKKSIGDIRDSTDFGTPSRVIADNVYHAVRQQIVNQAPGYARVMRDYETASDLLDNLQRTMSLHPNASVDTTLRKLQSILRNNANTNYGSRVELGNVLANSGARGADTIMPMLAGQMMNSATPRGLQALGAGGAGIAATGAAVGGNPWFIPALAAASPRLVGETAHAGGRAARLADQLNNMIPGSPATKRALAAQLARFPQEKDQQQ